jgi:hypothetical protein
VREINGKMSVNVLYTQFYEIYSKHKHTKIMLIHIHTTHSHISLGVEWMRKEGEN